MSVSHQFGGHWTEEKLERLKKYLCAYTTIFTKNIKASWYHTLYVDAFAGTGYRNLVKEEETVLLPLFEDDDVISFQKGSAYIALETEPSFNEYLFVEQSPDYTKELEKLKLEFPGKADTISIVQQEANSFLQSWCRQKNWNENRAVVFLDPYGMEVEWSTIECLAQTKAIDFWILFPLGQAVNRLLTKDHPPKDAWARRLTRLFGTDDWKEAFYRKERQRDLFGSQDIVVKEANFDSIGEYFVNRLKTIFAGVAKNPLPLRNSRNIPIFLLCFAASNPKGASIAVKIAQDVLKR